MKTAIFGNSTDDVDNVFGQGRRTRLAEISDLYPELICSDNFEAHAKGLAGVEAVFATWGTWRPEPEQLDRLPMLRAVFYAGGAIDYFAVPFLRRGITLFSAIKANAIPVSEFVVSHIFLGLKGYFRNIRETPVNPVWRGASGTYIGPGAYRENVSLIGDGHIARMVQNKLSGVDLDITMVPTKNACRGNDMRDAFSRGFVVSNHLPDLHENRNCIDAALLASLRPGATFINTGRDEQIAPGAVAEVAERRPDLTFIIDVTRPEPLPLDHPLHRLPNVLVSAHLAGSLNNELSRMADAMLDEFLRWRAGEPATHKVDPALLAVS